MRGAFDEYAVWAEEFEQDLIYLKKNGYTTIIPSQLGSFLRGEETLPEKAVMLTIDDGKLGVYKRAYPLLLLRQYGMTAVLTVIGEEIDAADPQTRAEEKAPYCTWDEIREMSDSGVVEIASHSYTRHRYEQDGHKGADIKEGESENDFFRTASNDHDRIDAEASGGHGKNHGCIQLSLFGAQRRVRPGLDAVRI